MKLRYRTLFVVWLGAVGWAAQADPVLQLEQQSAEMQRLSSASPTGAERRVAEDFSALAGSPDNARRLVSGLRSGDRVDLVWTDADGRTVTTTIDPATGKLGLGNVFISLSLAEQSLRRAGIAKPTPEQMNVALNGGAVVVGGKTVEFAGVLTQRASGAGWGRIANSLGVPLGPVVSAIRAENGRLRAAEAARGAPAGEAPARAAHGDAGERGPKAERPPRPDRPSRPDRGPPADRPARPERAR